MQGYFQHIPKETMWGWAARPLSRAMLGEPIYVSGLDNRLWVRQNRLWVAKRFSAAITGNPTGGISRWSHSAKIARAKKN
jgi:hypothetical protein